MEINEVKAISDDQLTEEGIKNALQPWVDKSLSGRSTWSMNWLGGATSRFNRRVREVFGPGWTFNQSIYSQVSIVEKEGWKIKVLLDYTEKRDYDVYERPARNAKNPPRAFFTVSARIVESPAIKKDREERAAKKVADRSDILTNYPPDEKDIQRIKDILVKTDQFRGTTNQDIWRVVKYLNSMALKINSKSKALRRGAAAYKVLLDAGYSEQDAIRGFDAFSGAAQRATNESLTFHGIRKNVLVESLRSLCDV